MDNLIIIVFLALGAASLIFPRIGIMAIFPANLFIPAAPIGIDAPILAFIFLFASIFIGTLIRFRIAKIYRLFSNTHKFTILAILLFNIAVLFSNDVNIYKWFRGIVPFLFLSIYLPVFFLLKEEQLQPKEIIMSICFTSYVTCIYVIYLYFDADLYKPVWHLFQNGLRFDFNPNLPVPENATVSGPLYLRVTLLWDKATTVMLILLPICSLVAATYANSRSKFIAWTSLLTISLVAMALTYTRSMIIVFVVSAILFGLTTFLTNTDKTSIKKYSISLIICILINIISSYALGYYKPIISRSVFGFETVANLMRQNEECTDNFTDGPCSSIGLSEGKDISNKHTDQNINTRLYEFGVAIDAFKKKPFLGHGLGYEYVLPGKNEISDDKLIKVAYMHNIVIYLLMTTGLLGFIGFILPVLYILLVSWEAQKTRVRRFNLPSNLKCVASIVFMSLFSMLIYACFFAVFRQISFNLILGALLGIGLAIKTMQDDCLKAGKAGP